MKKFLAMLLALVMALSLVACGEKEEPVVDDGEGEATIKVGVILVGDENEGYTFAHIDGIRKAMAACGLTDDNMVWCYNIPENEECYDKCIECVEQGCNLIITNSYSHQSYTQQAAEENPEVEFVAMTGDTAMKSGLANFHNAFNMTFESRYVSGIVAGMKLKELMDEGLVTDPYIGYVGAYPYAEVVSGYTGFFLGIKSIVPEAHMDVQYTNSWFNQQEEGKAAEALMGRGCVIIGQHADSTGAPAAVQAAKDAGKVVYSVGYNVDMLQAAPTAALTSSTNDWSVYYTYLFNAFLNGETIKTDWSEGYETGAVAITALGPEVAAGTAEAVAAAEAAIKDGSLHVFDTKTFTVDGQEVTSAFTFDSDGDWTNDTNEGIVDGYYHESEYISAPSFALRIDGITELNAG
ncbi:MAG: BMP family ABC transporter substrate-binding protein, partial [Clostridiales bacterium]|nr:BMP family ABC transporter substrate-binding protein [Clostridiales bacterium]